MEANERIVALVQLAERGLRFFQRRVADQFENAALLVAKQRAQREQRLAEVIVDEANDGRDAVVVQLARQLLFHRVEIAAGRTDAAGQLGFAEVDDAEFVGGFFAGDLRADGDRADDHLRAARAMRFEILLPNAIAVHVRLFLEIVEQRKHRVVRGDAAEVESRRLHFALVNLPRIAMLAHVAARGGDAAEELQLERAAADFFGELNHARGVVQHLNRFDS